MTIPGDLIGAVIGPGGKIIQEIQKETETTIVIEEVDGKGVIDVMATNGDQMEQALSRIKSITQVPEVGDEFLGKVKALAPYGAFVEVTPGKDGLLHISEIDWKRIDKVEDVLKEGDEVKVKIIDKDKKTGKLKLSRKVLIPRPEKKD
jgi:polyribonucleotide nucleotidyltransferase